jgi:nitroreductase
VEFADAVRRRRMVRDFDPERPVAEDDLDAVLAAMVRAPSAGHTQGVTLLVLTAAADLAAFWGQEPAESGWLDGMRRAPVLITVWTSREAYLDRYTESDKGWTDRDPERWSAPYWYVDAGMSAQSGLLAVVDRGLGACFFGIPPGSVDRVRRHFGVPAEQLSVGVLSLGHPAPGELPSGSPLTRRTLSFQARVRKSTWG